MARQPVSGTAPSENIVATEIDKELVARQRIPLTADTLGALDEKQEKLFLEIRESNITHLFKGMGEVRQSLDILRTELKIRMAPPQLLATVIQPDGSPANRIQVEFDPASVGRRGQPVTVMTGEDGAFTMPLPSALPLADNGSLELVLHGANSAVRASIPFKQIASNGLAGTIALDQFLPPLPVSILASLQSLAPPPPTDAAEPPPDNTPVLPVLAMGDCDECLLQFGANKSIDKFPYGVFFRLVEPRASVSSAVRRFSLGDRKFGYLPYYVTGATSTEQVSYVDRVPVEQPLSIDGFRDRLVGVKPNGLISTDETVPMAGTLGLGYVLHMSQRWTFQGLALGDLVYSLPLAPGEQQQVAIFERRDTSAVFESEFFDESQALLQSATADTSTTATFASAFNEVINGRSSFRTDSDTSSVGGSFFGLISGGSGSSSSSGTTSSSLSGQRNTTQNAAQATHSSAQSSAAARRSASRTGMRIASASERQSVTTKTITNHNHTRALTMQYWEVLRLYDVTTAIDGLTMTVLIPLQVVRFLPPNVPLTITSPFQLDTRAEVLLRYKSICKHADVLERWLPRKYHQGMKLLTQFAADPTAEVEAAGGVASDVIKFTIQGSFLEADLISIYAVTNRGTRVGPVQLNNTAPTPPADRFASREEFVSWLKIQRQHSAHVFTGALALPPSMNRSTIIGFEITRRFRSASYTLISKEQQELNALQALFGGQASWIEQAIESAFSQGSARTARQTITLDAAALEREVGGPNVSSFRAHVVELDQNGNEVGPGENYAQNSMGGVELPNAPYPVPALQLAPVLRFKEILEIEEMTQHVVRNTMRYSRAVWSSLTAEERAVLLEGYTIGVPVGGIQDPSQMVPLLNCVENRVLGFFGNSMIMPFFIPQVLAHAGSDGQPLDPAEIQESLLAYQQATFKPPHSTIALPTKGVLGEAVLGRCSSAEKIDITRFWNWQDSPSDTAPTISPVELPTGSAALTAGAVAPNSLTNLPSLINNVLTAPTPDTALLQSLGANAAAQKDFDSALTNAGQLAGLITNAQNVSNDARADALKTSKELQAQVIATAGNIVGGIYGGNPTAGSDAAAALNGGQQSGAKKPAAGDGKTPSGSTDGKSDTPSPSPANGQAGGSGGQQGGGNQGGNAGGGGADPAPAPVPGPQ
ncbi:hypothetical protein [Novosphingobium pentaromativorans]|uniref:Uncharacterized protein n=1 Tax=Novosphingobium pentaromativorans US6-1 TaxID=1088721 RepID=G6EKD2_9SPHN|nr:hypothetical protein [Novosphingobium pentaromativorans]AIT82889.1 hypothetical protein JI59_26005 [Novosphingobium pentaromativorans US6-1]EHJ58235.1 hypothetical protein NSU_4803 [Novosphingobium pentaromativorans US6-1]